MAKKAFSEQVAAAIRRGGSDIAQVSKAADRWLTEVYEPLWKETKRRFPNLQDHEFTNIVNHLNRVYDKEKIARDPEGFINEFASYVATVNQKVGAERKKLVNAKNAVIRTEKRIKELSELGRKSEVQKLEHKLAEKQKLKADIQEAHKAQKGAKAEKPLEKINKEIEKLEAQKAIMVKHLGSSEKATERLKTLSEELIKQREALSKIEAQYAEDVLSGKITPDMLDAKLNLTREQRELLKELKKPLVEAEAELEKAIIEREAASAKADYDFDIKLEYDEKVAKARETIKELKREQKLAMEAGIIPKELVIKSKKGRLSLYDPEAMPKLRKFLTEKEIRDVAEGVRNNIMKLNEEQLSGMIFEGLNGTGENVLQARTALWNDAQAEKWLVNDMEVLSGLYVDQLSKRTYLQDVLESYGTQDFSGITAQLKKERDLFEKDILKKPNTPERANELSDLNKRFDKTTDYLEKVYAMYMGNYIDRSSNAYRITNTIKQFGAATQLANVPILMLSDFLTPLTQFTFSEYIFDSLVPAINYFKNITRKYGEEYARPAFADLGLGVNVWNGNKMQALFGYGAQYQPKTLIERYVSNLASAVQNVSGVNVIADFQEVTCAFGSESKSLRALKQYVETGKLDAKAIKRLDEIRLNPKEWGERISKQREQFGKEVDGAFISNYHLWDDQDAARALRIATSKDVRRMILKPDLLEQPFAFRDPVFSLFTQYTSWIFSATVNYTIPALTDLDQQKMIGLIAMMASASLIDALRQLSKGEDVDTSFRALFVSALTNSGIFGWQYDATNRINSIIDIPLLRGFQPDRFKRKGWGALAAGPASGTVDSFASVASAVLNGEMNHKDGQRALKLFVPFANTLALRYPLSKMLDSFDLPKTREQARKRKEF